ncbi:hypothetical protein FACS1894137_02610 [Spirochaetia bacterium]|nr:hypothetical protein FACS1894137_02610 [Spirochaetia bacterium]
MEDKPQIQALAQQVSYSGPLPTASEFAAYDKALAGAAERLLVMTEQQAEHRRKMDEKIVDKSLRLNSMGQIISFIISIISLGAVCLCVVLSQPGASIAPALIAIPSILSVIFNRKK